MLFYLCLLLIHSLTIQSLVGEPEASAPPENLRKCSFRPYWMRSCVFNRIPRVFHVQSEVGEALFHGLWWWVRQVREPSDAMCQRISAKWPIITWSDLVEGKLSILHFYLKLIFKRWLKYFLTLRARPH